MSCQSVCNRSFYTDMGLSYVILVIYYMNRLPENDGQPSVWADGCPEIDISLRRWGAVR